MATRLYFISIFVIWGFVNLQAQQAISIDELVQKVYEQNSTEMYEGYKMPWLDEVNVRSETRDWRLRQQSYSLRLSPISLGERRASSKLYNSWRQEIEYLKLEEVYDKVADIHEDWVKQDFINRRVLLNEEILALLSDVEKVALKQSAIDADKLSLLLTVRSRIATLNNNNALKSIERQKLLEGISAELDGEYQVKSDSINVNSYMVAVKEALISTNRPYVASSDLIELQTIDNEMALEKAEQERVLDFVQLQYQGPHDDEVRERVSLGLSLNLPFFAANKLSIAKLQVEKDKEEYRLEQQKQESLDELAEIKASLVTQLSEYESYEALFANIESDNLQLIDNMSNQAFINPTIRLNHEISVLDNQLSLLDLKENIIRTYLDYLQATDKYQLGIRDFSTIK